MIRAVAMGLPRVSMARIPLVAFANSRTSPISHANSAHPKAYSSMSPRNSSKKKDNTTWVRNAKKVADKLEHSAQKLAGSIDRTTKDCLREVKQFDNAEDELIKGLAVAAMKNSHQNAGTAHHNKSGGKGIYRTDSSTTVTDFEQQIIADVIHPESLLHHDVQHHHQEMVSSLIEELNEELKADKRASNLSQHASDAIRMVESRSILKQDGAPIHAVGDEDPSSKDVRDDSKHK